MSVDATTSDGNSNSQHVLTSMKIYFVILACSCIAFEFIRRRPFFKLIYKCRSRTPQFNSPYANRSFGFGEWIRPAIRATDEEILDLCGLDALCLVRFLRLGRKVACCGILLSGILFPVYATAQWTRTDVDAIERIALNILQENDERYWAAVVAMYVISAYTMRLLHLEYKDFIARRHHFLSKWNVQQYSVVITDLPRNLRTKESLAKYLDHLFPNAVHAVVVGIDCSALEKLVVKRIKYRNKLERALALYAAHGSRPLHLVQRRRTNVDAIDYFGGKLDRLNTRIPIDIGKLEAQQVALYEAMADDRLEDASCVSDPAIEKASNSGVDPTLYRRYGASELLQFMRPTAFVTFRTLLSTQMAQQLLQTSKPTQMLVEAAPPASDVIWKNLGLSLRLRHTLTLFSRYVTIAIVVFWTIPSTVVTSFSSVDSLKKVIPSLSEVFMNYPWLEGLFKQLAPLSLVIMTALAPLIFLLLSRREGLPSEQRVQSSLFKKLAYFQFIQIFAVSVIVGSVLDSLRAILDNPVNLITMLAKSIPAQAANFMSYLVVKTGLSLVLELYRVGPLFLGFVYALFAPRLTKREQKSPWYGLRSAIEPDVLHTSQILPDYYQAILLTLTFCPMSPLLCYFSAIYFLVSEIVYLRQLLFVYDSVIDSTGLFWHPLYNLVVSALCVAQVILVGILSLKKAPGPVVASAILPILTWIAHRNILQLYPRTASFLPLLDCVRIDTRRQHDTVPFSKDTYIQPALLAHEPLKPDHPEVGIATAAEASFQQDDDDLEALSGYFLSD